MEDSGPETGIYAEEKTQLKEVGQLGQNRIKRKKREKRGARKSTQDLWINLEVIGEGGEQTESYLKRREDPEKPAVMTTAVTPTEHPLWNRCRNQEKE